MMDEARSEDPGLVAARRRVRRRLSAQELRDRRRRIVTWTLSITLGVLLVNAIVGESGYLANVQGSRDEAELKAVVSRLRLDNQALQREMRRLENDPAAVEEAARRDLGFVRPGETLVILRDAPSVAPAPAAR